MLPSSMIRVPQLNLSTTVFHTCSEHAPQSQSAGACPSHLSGLQAGPQMSGYKAVTAEHAWVSFNPSTNIAVSIRSAHDRPLALFCRIAVVQSLHPHVMFCALAEKTSNRIHKIQRGVQVRHGDSTLANPVMCMVVGSWCTRRWMAWLRFLIATRPFGWILSLIQYCNHRNCCYASICLVQYIP